MAHYSRTNINELIDKHRTDPRYDTDVDAYSDDELTTRNYLGSEGIIPLCTPGSGLQLPGVVGYIDYREMFNEATRSDHLNLSIAKNYREVYHPPAPVFIDPLQFEDWFIVQSYSLNQPRFPRSSWPRDADAPAEDNFYWSRKLHAPDWDREATAEQVDPADVHEQQVALSEFEVATQAGVNPDALDPEDDRLEDLPAYIDADERDDCLNKYDPKKNSVKSQCDHCGGEDPWLVPLERGIHAVREGGFTEGTLDYDQCEPEDGYIKSCDCCGCPSCGGQSISHRKTMSPSYRCNSCGLEFEHPIELPNDDAQRARLYWRCRHCRKPTKAPFPGIPTDLLDD